jgi:aspartokinase-like uncharacterized kinase
MDWPVRIVLLIALLLCNSLMLNLLVKAMHQLGTVTATTLTSSFSFAASVSQSQVFLNLTNLLMPLRYVRVYWDGYYLMNN